MDKKKVLVVGCGLSAVAVCRYFSQQDADITVTDLKKREALGDILPAIEAFNVKLELERHNLDSFLQAEIIAVSPGVPLSHPHIVAAKEKGVRITSEMDIALTHIQRPIIGITGTNGKTTTTTLIGSMLQAQGYSVFVGGNIGKPLLDYVLDGHSEDYVVAEISSFQLESIGHFTPRVVVFTNIEPDHMDRYADFSAYVHAKKRMLYLCDDRSAVFLNADNSTVAEFASEKIGTLFWFSTTKPSSSHYGTYVDSATKSIISHIVTANGQVSQYRLDISKFKAFGAHNRENLAAAISVTHYMGVGVEAIQKVIHEFQGVPHRLEFVRKKDGVYFINDSKGTNVLSMQKSLAAFPHNPLILIAGGKDKGADFTCLSQAIRQQCKVLILVGEAKETINRAIGDYTETYLVGTFEEAVLLAYQKSRSGDIVLLSPGCASYDMFKNFEDRGNYFKKLVFSL